MLKNFGGLVLMHVKQKSRKVVLDDKMRLTRFAAERGPELYDAFLRESQAMEAEGIMDFHLRAEAGNKRGETRLFVAWSARQKTATERWRVPRVIQICRWRSCCRCCPLQSAISTTFPTELSSCGKNRTCRACGSTPKTDPCWW